jgi:N-acetyl-alpha-D-muramate 1-phosphate uridylyltransferase
VQVSGHEITRAMVMAAGLGTRMAPLTREKPKALIECCGKPLIDHTLDRLAAVGVQHVVVNVHHFADDLETHLRARCDPRIEFSDERDQLLETGGGLVKAAARLGDGPVFVCNIDAVFDDCERDGFADLAAMFDAARMDALLLLVPNARARGYGGTGDFCLLDDRRIARPGIDDHEQAYAFTGVQVLHPRVLQGRAVERFSTNRIWDEILCAGRAFGCVYDGVWYHVGDPHALAETQAALCP